MNRFVRDDRFDLLRLSPLVGKEGDVSLQVLGYRSTEDCYAMVNERFLALCGRKESSTRRSILHFSLCLGKAVMALAHRCILLLSFDLGNTGIALAQELVLLRRQLSWSFGRCNIAMCVRGFSSSRGGSFSPSVWSCCARVSCAKDVPSTAEGPLSGQKVTVEKLWREFFSNPSHWWDHRSEKSNPKYPDFTHKKTQQSLWLSNNVTPRWVEAELAAMAPGVLQSDIFSWNIRLRRYVKAGDYEKTMELFQQLQREGTTPDRFTFVSVLNACSNLQALDAGRLAHEQIINRGYESDIYVANSLVDMYSKCGSVDDARRVFNKMPSRTVVSWSALILGYVRCGQGREALELSCLMQREGVDLNPVTFVAVLNACASIGALEEGRRVHEHIIDRGYDTNAYVANSLLDMYAKCGSIGDAQRVFDKMPTRNVVSWSALILGYVKCGQGQEALDRSHLMQLDGVDLNPITFVGVLNACASIGALEEGRRVHAQILNRGYSTNSFVANSLVDMYAKCGSIEDAQRVFNKMPTRNVISWSALIMGYVKCGQGQEALELSQQMQRERVDFNPVTFIGVLNACASIGALEEGRRIHAQIIDKGYECYGYMANALVDMYAKCGSINDAWRIFIKMRTKGVVAWNSLLLGYVKCGQGQEALGLYQQMLGEGLDLNSVTFVGVLNACASTGSLEEGRCVHEQIIDKGYEDNVFVGNALVDMYGKSGSIEDAQRVFNKMPTRDSISWNAMLAGYGNRGYAKEALGHFEQMSQEVEVSTVSFISLLAACSHSGLVDEGMHYLDSMTAVFNISPTLEHYSCVIDLLGRAGHLHEAEDLVKKMQPEASASVLMSLLSACRTHGNVDMGERVAKQVMILDPANAASYVLLSNIYAAVRH